jgi:galactokinase
MTPNEIRELFRSHFGAEPEVVSVGPGRINLIGEHTDYNDGFVFPAAIDRVTYVAAALTEGRSNLFSERAKEGEPFNTESVQPGELTGWARYPAGMAWALRESGYHVRDLRAVVWSNIPFGSGVSSSAALEMAFGVIWRKLDGLDVSLPQLALIAKLCENRFVGVNSGIMDQMASAMGRQGQAMFLDTRSLEIEYAPVPGDLAIVLCDTKKERAHTTSAYNERRAQCEQAAKLLGVPALRDAGIEDLEAARDRIEDVIYRRAKHVITENDRARRFKQALDAGDRKAVGELMRASHESLRDDYEVSCAELDWMAEAAWNAPGCVGARMTGGGFGGACVALVEAGLVERFVQQTLSSFVAAGGLKEAEAMPCRPVQGAHVIES